MPWTSVSVFIIFIDGQKSKGNINYTVDGHNRIEFGDPKDKESYYHLEPLSNTDTSVSLFFTCI